MSDEIWRVELVHGPDNVDVEGFDSLHRALGWVGMKGSEYHPRGVDCLALMDKAFRLESPVKPWYQYGTNYHWVVIEKIA